MTAADLRGRALSILIVAFCLWHMAAVTLYLLPSNLAKPVDALKDFTSPYILLFSQWQKWDIFSPDPEWSIGDYTIEEHTGTTWSTIMTLTYQTLPWRQRVKEMKILDRITSEEWSKLIPPYLYAMCPKLPGAAGQEIRLEVHTRLLPFDLGLLTHLATQTLPVTDRQIGSVRCPSA